MTEPIHDVIDRWNSHLRGELPGGLDGLIDEDCVFYSPIVFTPQEGRDLTKMYLAAAFQTLPGDAGTGEPGSAPGPGPNGTPDDEPVVGAFRYTKKVLSGTHAVLEFETTVEGKYVNGVDIITCNDEGRIVEFRVMIRPLQAMNIVHAQMKAMLESMASGGGTPR